MLPSIEVNLSELDQLYNIINTMYDKVIPSIKDDLTNIEALVTSFERSHSREQHTAMNVFLNYLSSSNDSNDDKRGQTLSSITLHDKDEFLQIIRDSKYDYSSNDDNTDGISNDDNIDNNDNDDNATDDNDGDDDDDSKSINITLGLAMPITLGDSLRKKTKKTPI